MNASERAVLNGAQENILGAAPHTDGVAVVVGAANWREDAINVAMQGFNYGETEDALIWAIRRANAESANAQGAQAATPPSTLQLWTNRARLLEFLQLQPDFRSLLESEHLMAYDEGTRPMLGWFAVSYQGCEVEIALPPSASSAVLLGRDMKLLETFAREAEAFANRPRGRCLRYANGVWESAPDIDKSFGQVTWDDIVLPPETLRGLREAVEGFFTHREAITSFGFAWKRGVLLIGPPGTGKTLVCKAVASALPDLPYLYVRDLHAENKREVIQDVFSRARELSPCIVAFEDIDGLIDDHNRTVFLNEMDGFESNEGLLVIASSNHPGKIDEALLRRPSRFDRVFHLGLPKLEERRAFCERVLARPELQSKLAPGLNVRELSDGVAAKTDGFTPAYLKEAFVSAALHRALDGATLLDEEFARAVMAQVDELRAHLKRTKNPDALGQMRGDDAIGFLT